MNTDDDFILDLSASCTRDQAVMRLLGWGRDTVYSKKIRMSEDGDLDLDSKHVYAADFSLEEFLGEMYRGAQNAYLRAVPIGASDDEVDEILIQHFPMLDRAERMVKDARRYLIDIVDELAQGPKSGLRLDAERTAKTGTQHITIKSLDEWSEEKYQPNPNIVGDSPEDDDPSIGKSNKPIDEMSKTERALYTVLGLVAEAYAKELGEVYFGDGQINLLKTAEAVSGHADSYLDGDRSFPGQGLDSIRARLTTARSCLELQKKSVLKSGKRK